MKSLSDEEVNKNRTSPFTEAVESVKRLKPLGVTNHLTWTSNTSNLVKKKKKSPTKTVLSGEAPPEIAAEFLQDDHPD